MINAQTEPVVNNCKLQWLKSCWQENIILLP